MAIDAFGHVTGTGYEGRLEELINWPCEVDPLPDRGVDPLLLAAARERLYRAGREWAATVAAQAGAKDSEPGKWHHRGASGPATATRSHAVPKAVA